MDSPGKKSVINDNLVCATLLSIVPLLAVMFSLLKGFGYHNELEPFLSRILKLLGDQVVQTIVPTIVNFVGNANIADIRGTEKHFILCFRMSGCQGKTNAIPNFRDQSGALFERIGKK